MKKFLVILFSLLFLSCNFANYIYENAGQTTGVDFTNGKWLLNEINVPASLTEKITKLAIEDFSENLGSRLSYAPTTSGLMLPQKEIKLNPNKSVLTNLYKGTQYDYFINIKGSDTKNEFGSIDFTNHHMKNGDNLNSSEITIEIYDLKNTSIIYSQKVIASVSQGTENSDVTFSKSHSQLILSAYKRLIRDINKKSIH